MLVIFFSTEVNKAEATVLKLKKLIQLTFPLSSKYLFLYGGDPAPVGQSLLKVNSAYTGSKEMNTASTGCHIKRAWAVQYLLYSPEFSLLRRNLETSVLYGQC